MLDITVKFNHLRFLNLISMQGAMHEISRSLGDIPILETEMRKSEDAGGDHNEEEESTFAQKRVTDMGTYASESAYTASKSASSKKESDRPPLRALLFEGNFFVGASLATCLTKLALKYLNLVSDPRKQNRFLAECMLTLTTILHFGKSSLPKKSISDDDVDRIAVCLKVSIHENHFTAAFLANKYCGRLLVLLNITLIFFGSYDRCFFTKIGFFHIENSKCLFLGIKRVLMPIDFTLSFSQTPA